MNITEFLLARIAEDEKDAIDRVVLRAEDRRSLTMDDAEKIHAEIAAKRAIIRRYQDAEESYVALSYVIEALAAVYKDHADYDPAWSPNAR